MPGNPKETKIYSNPFSDTFSERSILHCDLNNFYASVECLHNPGLRNIPVAVGGSEKKRHGIILAKNQIAKTFGVKTAEPIWQAKIKCPTLVIVPPNMNDYIRYSKLVREIYERYTDCIEPFGIDECWLDVTGSKNLMGSGVKIADDIRKDIKNELGLTISVGVSWNKIFAKLGSDMKKPDATTVITKENYREMVWPLPVEDLLFVGKKTSAELKRIGIDTIGRLAVLKEKFLEERFGKWGITLWSYANGYDAAPVEKDWKSIRSKGIGNSTTLPADIYSLEEARKIFLDLAESVCKRMRNEKVKGNTISISLKTSDLKYKERQKILDAPSNIPVHLTKCAMFLLEKNWHPGKDKPIRALGIRMTGLTDSSEPVQMSLFDRDQKPEKNEMLEKTINSIREKYGDESVIRALILKREEDQF